MKQAISTIDVAAPERYAYLDLTEDLQRAIKDAIDPANLFNPGKIF